MIDPNPNNSWQNKEKLHRFLHRARKGDARYTKWIYAYCLILLCEVYCVIV